MKEQQYREWLLILKKMGYGLFQACTLIRDHMEGAVPIEGSQFQTVKEDDEDAFDLGGSD